MKIVVFDLDETLGYFTEFGIFWDSLTIYLKTNNKQALSQFQKTDSVIYTGKNKPNNSGWDWHNGKSDDGLTWLL